MTRLVWVTAAVLVAGRATADVLGTDLDPRRVAALILIALFVTALAVGYIRRTPE